MILGANQPVLPDGYAAIAIIIDVAIGGSRNPAADFKDLGLPVRIPLGQNDLNVEL